MVYKIQLISDLLNGNSVLAFFNALNSMQEVALILDQIILTTTKGNTF